jgi:hypothetical protein
MPLTIEATSCFGIAIHRTVTMCRHIRDRDCLRLPEPTGGPRGNSCVIMRSGDERLTANNFFAECEPAHTLRREGRTIVARRHIERADSLIIENI